MMEALADARQKLEEERSLSRSRSGVRKGTLATAKQPQTRTRRLSDENKASLAGGEARRSASK